MSAALAASDSDELQDLFDSVAAACTARRVADAPSTPRRAPDTCPDLLTRIGQLTRTLHDSLRELGYDRVLADAASSIPDARERLAYVATLTERAAQRVLDATEVARPIQDELGRAAATLASRWRAVYAAQTSVAEFKSLADATLEFLDHVPARTSATSAQLMEIVLAQDFQDLTGQVIKRINELVHNLESQLLKLLLESTPVERRPAGAESLLNGPVVDAARSGEVVTSQAQVDDLLDSLGF